MFYVDIFNTIENVFSRKVAILIENQIKVKKYDYNIFLHIVFTTNFRYILK